MDRFRHLSSLFTLFLTVGVALLLSGAAGLESVDRLPHPSGTATRLGEAVTLLPDGRWLLTGGEDGQETVPTVRLWDARTEHLTTVPSGLRRARAWHSATVLPDGNVLLFGGVGADGQIVAESEIFLPTTNTVMPFSSGSLTPRAHHSATLLTDGTVLVAGGVTTTGETLNTAELWDFRTPDAGRRTLDLLVSARRDHTAVLLPSGKVVLWEGVDATGTHLPGGEWYDPQTHAWTPLRATHAVEAQTTDGISIVASIPVDGTSNVSLESLIALRFSMPVNVQTVTASTITLHRGAEVQSTTVTAAEGGMLAFLLPQTALRPATSYTVTVNGVQSEQGHALPRTDLRFTTTSQPGPARTARGAEGNGNQGNNDDPDTDTDDDWTPDNTNRQGDWRIKRSESAAQFLPPLQAPEGVTALAGQVLKLNGKPLKNVTVQIGEVSTQTDRNGQFLLAPLSHGHYELLVDGTTANKPNKTFGLFEIGVEIAPGVTTVLSYTVWMPLIDTRNAVTIASPITSETVITTPRIPGLELHLPAGTVITDHDGNPVQQLSITPIPVDRPPHPLPVNVHVPVYFTIQPGGAYIKDATQTNGKGGWLVYPNYVNEAAGARFDFWRYDPESLGWTVYGQGTVTPSRSQVVPDANVRIYEFTGAMINGGGSPGPPGPPPCDNPCLCGNNSQCSGSGGGGGTDGDPVDLGTGLFLFNQTDLAVPDVLPLTLTRSYHQNDVNTRPFGIGTTHPYAMFLWSANQYQEVDLILPDGGRVHYVRTSLGTHFTNAVFESTATPTRFYKSRIAWNGKGWDLFLKDGTVYVFGENAPLLAIRDRLGNTVSLTYSGVNSVGSPAGNITQLTSPNGRWIKFTYDASNRITQAQDHSGRTVSYTYDASGRLWKVTDPAGGIEEYTYDTSHRLLTRKDKRGTIMLTNQYDANGRVSQQTLADGGTYQFVYTLDANGKVTQTDVTNPRGKVRRVTLNSNGYLLTDTRAVGLPEQQVTTFVRQAGTNLPTSVTDPLGRQTTYAYDAFGNVTSVTRLAGTVNAVTTSFTYTSTFNQLATITDPLNHTTTLAYDTLGNVTSVTDATNRQVTLTYDSQGQPLTITTPAGTTTLTYVLGDLATVNTPLNYLTTRLTDTLGRLLKLTNPMGQVTEYTYDSLDRLTQVKDPLTLLTTFAYDPNSNLLSLTDARNNVTQYTYDTKDRVVTRKDPLLRQESFVYDGLNNLTQNTDRKSQVTSTTYDSLDRPTVVTYAGGETVTATYDAGNRLTQLVDSVNGTITRSYDDLDRLTSETTPQGTVSYTYDNANRRTSMTVTGQPAVTYAYDDANRLTQITKGSDIATFTYDSSGRRSTLTFPNTIVLTYGYDADSQLTSLTYTKGATTLGTLTYTYDKVRRRLSTSGTFAGTDIPSAISTANYDAANQQLTLGTKSATYDNNGNLQTLTDASGTTTYTWNSRNQLTAISGPGFPASFQYDALGRRRGRTVGGTARNFLYDSLNVVQELNGTTPVANLLTGLGIDEVLVRTESTGALTFLTDILGSTIALADSTGTIQTQYSYEPFGRTLRTGASSSNGFKFTGREDDATKMYYFRARYYHPELHRFISQDPVGFRAGDPNLYAYVVNNPVNLSDPDGRIPLALPIITGAIGAVTSAGGNALAQWYNTGCINLPDVYIAGGVGFAAGAAAPFVATSYAGAMLLGAGANVAQYGLSQGLSGMTPAGVAVSAATGAVAGGIAGPASAGTGQYATGALSKLDQGVASALNQAADIGANTATSNILRNTIGGVAGNIVPTP